MPPKRASVRKTREELIRIWQKVDKKNAGVVTVEDVLKEAKSVEADCPELIADFDKMAKGGKVTRQGFLDFFLGKASGGGKSPAESAVDREVDLNELKDLFNEIVRASGRSELRVSDLVEHRARIKTICPQLLDSFTVADVDGSCTLSWDEVRIFAAGTDEWLEFQFDRIIGLEGLKDQIRQFHRSVALDRKRCEGGHEVRTGGTYHMIFQGNPGTGKTTVARLVAQLLCRIGITKSELLVEVQRDKLVAEYVGQTGPKTQQVIESATSGVLFIDEAYRLSQAGGKNDFGKEAIEQLMAVMNDPPGKAPVMVFAGYPDDMDAFMKANSGLFRRISYTFDFSDYSPEDLSQILDYTAKKAGFELAPDLRESSYSRLAGIITRETLPEARSLMNGGLCERIFAFAKQNLDAREIASHATVPSVVLTEPDILEACRRIPPPPPRDSPSDSPAGGGGAADAALAARAARIEARNDALQSANSALQVQVASLEAELASLRRSASGDAATTLARTEGRLAASEAEVQRLHQELADLRKASVSAPVPGPAKSSSSVGAGGGRGGGTIPPPLKYEVEPCLRYSSGCCWFFLLVLLHKLWQLTCFLARRTWAGCQIARQWCAEKMAGGGPSPATVAPAPPPVGAGP